MNPNGLSDYQIAARPEPYEGMLCYDQATSTWFRVGKLLAVAPDECDLLPGEPGCPWPPPQAFQRVCKCGEWAWILVEDIWAKALVVERHGTLEFTADHPDDFGVCFAHIETPTIHIPFVEVDDA